MLKNAQQFICRCGKYRGWLTEGERTSPCPDCGRVYKGKYNSKSLQIEAIIQSQKNMAE